METSDPSVHSFIVKIWIEEGARADGRAGWHGHVTHVPGGERRYLKRLDDIADFITPYLEEMNVAFGPCDRLRRWLRWLLRQFTSEGQKFS